MYLLYMSNFESKVGIFGFSNSNKIKDLSSQVNELKTEIDDLNVEFDALDDQFLQRFKAVESRLKRLERRMSASKVDSSSDEEEEEQELFYNGWRGPEMFQADYPEHWHQFDPSADSRMSSKTRGSTKPHPSAGRPAC